MRGITLYQHLLGIAPPWTVSKVELNLESQRVDVWGETFAQPGENHQ